MGAGFKDFASEVLRSVDVDDYLMKQSVMVFDTAAARDAAIAVPEEGMHAYLADSNKVTVYDGTAWRESGGYILTTKGDVLVATASGLTRLGVGADGTALIADSAETAGVKWGSVVTDRAVISGFGRDTPGTGGPFQMLRAVSDSLGNVSGATIPVTLDRAGSIVGLSVAQSVARTAGSLTFEVYKNGTATGLTVLIDATNPQYSYGVQASGLDMFVAGDRLDVRVTASSYSGSGLVEASVTVQYG